MHNPYLIIAFAYGAVSTGINVVMYREGLKICDSYSRLHQAAKQFLTNVKATTENQYVTMRGKDYALMWQPDMLWLETELKEGE